VGEILEGVAATMASGVLIPDGPIEVRMDHIVNYLNEHGYTAVWKRANGGTLLSITNCPYEQVTCKNAELCKMDKRLVDDLVGVRTQRVTWKQDDGEACSYLVPNGSH
jgi:predicted ArsR family transcriptional regulator